MIEGPNVGLLFFKMKGENKHVKEDYKLCRL